MGRARITACWLMAIAALGLAGCTSAASPPSPASTTIAGSAAAATAPAARPTEPSGGLAASMSPARPVGPTIKVGFIAPLSGPVASYGALAKHAPALALKETNDSGGINGSPVELVTFDSPNNPNLTVTGMRRLANEDKVLGIVGPYYTGEMQAAVPLLKELKVPTLAYTAAASHPGVVEPNEWVFLADTNEEIPVAMSLDAFKKVYPNVRKVAIVGDTQTAVTALAIKEVWPKLLPQKGFEIVDTITYQFNTTDFSPIVTRFKASGAEAVALSSLAPAGLNFLQELDRQRVKVPVVSSTHLGTVPPLPKILGKVADGLIQTMYFSMEEARKPRVREWLARYEALAAADNPGGEKPIIGYAQEPQAYDAFAILMKAMRDAGVKGDTPVAEAREKVRRALMKIKGFPGVLRSKDITANGRITWDFYPLIARDGEYRPIE